MKSKNRDAWPPLRIAFFYTFFGVLWILFSDSILLSLSSDPEYLSRLQTYKGWFFILVTAMLLFGFMESMMRRRETILHDLWDSEEYNRLLFELSPMGLALCRMDGTLVDLNPAYARIIGRSVEETLQLSYWDITPQKYADQERAQLKSLEETGRYGPYEKEYIHQDGHFVPVRLQGRLIERGGEQCIWSSVEDVTEYRQMELLLASEKDVLEMLSRGAVLPEVLERIVLSIEALSPETIASILLLDADGSHVRSGAAPSLPEAYNRAIDGEEIGPRAGSCGTAVYRREPVIVSDIETDPLWENYRELARAHGLRACWSTPIMNAAGTVLGTFAMYFRKPSSPREEDFGLIARATHMAEIVIERRTVEKALQRNEQVLRLFVEHSPAAIAMFDTDMKYVVASRRFLMDYDLGDQEIIGRSHYEVFPEIPERWKEIHRRCLAGAVEKSEEELFARADGKMDWVRWEIRPWYETQGEIGGIILFSEVITERKKATEEVQRINKELRAVNRIIMACASTMVVEEILDKVLDEALQITGLEGGTICFVTPGQTLHIAAHRATSQATIEDLTTQVVKVGDCLCGECARDHKPLILADREAVLKFSTREATRGEDIRFHAAFPLVTGESCLGVLCIFTRTDAKPTEKSLQLLETVSVQIALALDNARLYAERVQQAATLEDKVLKRTAELDETRMALLNLVEDLNNANEKLKELDRLKSMFIAAMSHELRTPLNSIIGFSGILLQGLSGEINEEQRDQLGRVFRAGKHLLSLITDVIDIAKIESGKITPHPEKFDLHALIDEAVGQVRQQAADKGLAMEESLPEHPLVLHADRKRLLQCLLNYLSNAVKFTEKGTISISAREVGDTMEFAVKDTGIGIRSEEIPLLFGSFVRLDSHLKTATAGTGLGLYLTKKLVTEVLGGVVEMESKVGEGSRFVLRVPVH